VISQGSVATCCRLGEILVV